MNKKITTNDGVEIPLLGLGTWLARGRDCQRAVEFALTHGYDHIDTAQGYDNEKDVGKGWKASGRSREDIYITTKITTSNQGYEKSMRSLEKSLKALQTDYVDLLLIHWPNLSNIERTFETWQALVELHSRGLTRSIGVSNFPVDLLEDLLGRTDVVPAINQVEFHAFLYQQELLAYCREKRIQIEAYSPVARAKFFDHEKLVKIAQKYSRTPAQVMLAWLVNHDLVTIPKSIHEARILENADIFFQLDGEDMHILDNLQPQRRLVEEPNLFKD
ncbi:MAG: aldo/keto reductase [Anaerolineaceae bacterium]